MRYKLNMKEECIEVYEEHMTNNSEEHMINNPKEYLTDDSIQENQVISQMINMNESSEEKNKFKYQMFGNAIQYGSVLISEGIKAISHIISQKKELELEQLKKEMAIMENKKIENDNIKKRLELELNNIENDYLNNSIINYKYEKNLSNTEKMEEIHNNLKNELKNIINELILNDNFIENIKKKNIKSNNRKKKVIKNK